MAQRPAHTVLDRTCRWSVLLATTACLGFSCRSTPRPIASYDEAKRVRQNAEEALARADFERARSLADRLVAAAWSDSSGSDWNTGNLWHHGYRLRGLAALGQGNIDEAKSCLLSSGHPPRFRWQPASPQLFSFGPNMMLAKVLLERGENAAVLEYLEACRSFWNFPTLLDDWKTRILRGEVPDFGANLHY